MRLRARGLALALGLVLGCAAGAAGAQGAPTPRDFAHGLSLTTQGGLPVHEFTVPEPVYQGVLRADLGDLRVFNGGGIVVPHALCTAPVMTPATVSELALPVFPLQSARQMPQGVSQTARVNVQTPGGTSVQVIEGGGSPALTPGTPAQADGFVVDASATTGPLRALRLAWSTPDGASEAQVRVEASENLNQWRTVVAATTLLHVAADGRALDRNHIELPEERYRYLRLVRSEGPAVAIDGVTADVVRAGTVAGPQWFAALPVADALDPGFVFDAGRLAPVHTAAVDLPLPNMSLRVALESRRAPEQPWQVRWAGEVSSVSVASEARDESIRFSPTSDPLWRVRVLRGAESLGGARPVLRLGYHAARLRFLAQGDGPFAVGYGSARVPAAEAIGCDGLLAHLPAEGREALIGTAEAAVAPAGAFGGPEALTPPSEPTPVRQIVLWAVLLLGTAALVAMALALLRRLRDTDAAG